MHVWARFLHDNINWVPITPRSSHPPLRYLNLTTDAAGWDEECSRTEVGLGCIGLDEEGSVFFANQTLWDTDNMGMSRDSKNKFLGNKTTSLEFVGILLPFLLSPSLFNRKHVVVGVDNIGCYFAWQNGYSSGDNLASILVRILVLLSAMLCCVVHIEHVKRMSTWESCVADRLSRSKTTTSNDRLLFAKFPNRDLPVCFKE